MSSHNKEDEVFCCLFLNLESSFCGGGVVYVGVHSEIIQIDTKCPVDSVGVAKC